ncbi:Y-family DNA polymerase [Vibrio agarivorans]|uniref:Y-family DNA polymerase n=1 Tax=Vibrio agarivorans TaxID=153622 RepID=UPI0025B3B75D|nr:DNA polymerase Y family protein [Vibrio agarivorans]MDN3662974.1 DNA polymerase Y family protein [Vibrio agarivorans]
MVLWIYLHFPRLQLDALFTHQANEAQVQGEEKEHPTVVVETRHHNIVQANDAALADGVKVGMGLGSASALCPKLNVHPFDLLSEEVKLQEVAQWLYLITSDIVLYPPNGLLLKATNMLTLYEGLESYWQAVKKHLDSLAISYQFACGFSPYSAMLLAKQGANLLSECRDTIVSTLSPLPLHYSELETKHVEQLNRVGIKDFAGLLALPLKEVARRFNIDLVNYVGRLLGQLSHPVRFFHPKEQFERSLELLYDVENIQWLQRPLTRLLKQLDSFLTLRNLVAYELILTLHQRDNPPQNVTFTSGGGDYRYEKWLKLCALTLESIKLDAAVYHLTLKAVRVSQINQNYIDIFEGDKGGQNQADLIALLQAKLGNHNVTRPLPSADHRPEKSTRYINADRDIAALPTSEIQRLRPTRLVQPPQRLTEHVELIHGPERIVTGWWDGDSVTRDYFIAQTPQGLWLWVFRTEQKLWFLHGYFS